MGLLLCPGARRHGCQCWKYYICPTPHDQPPKLGCHTLWPNPLHRIHILKIRWAGFCQICSSGSACRKSRRRDFAKSTSQDPHPKKSRRRDFAKSALQDQHPKNPVGGILPNPLHRIRILKIPWAGFCQICSLGSASQKSRGRVLTEKPARCFGDKRSTGGNLPTLRAGGITLSGYWRPALSAKCFVLHSIDTSRDQRYISTLYLRKKIV